jgi:hypothetical protein
MWRAPVGPSAGTAAVRLRLLTKSRVRAGRAATVRWSARGAARVTRWRVLLDGRSVGTVAAGKRSLLRRRVSRPGTHHWKVVGLDAKGALVVAAARSFRVLRKR